ncbi:MAG: hypothetical protein LBR71_02610 [Synergistaceae bacterium]|jgi:hypothetical protein|nr:hypothetical protein [Synergistaceae bacterium]
METEQRRISSRPVIAAAVVILGLLAVLGGFRVYSFRLEYFLSEINREIEAHSAEEMELWQIFSGLTSPIKIYSYCKDKLGMDTPRHVEIVRVRGPRVAVAPPPPNPKGWRSGILSFFGFAVN